MAKTTKKTITKVKPIKKIEEVKIAPKIVLVTHLNKDAKISPRKLRLLANDIKKYNPFDIITRLQFVNSSAARILINAIKNAIADAKNNYHLNPDSLKFHRVEVNEGTKIKRMDKSHGYRFSRGIITKRHSRLTIILSGEEINQK